jgi:hypothetical protein
MRYLRDQLVGHYGKQLGCYSGDGGEHWDGDTWKGMPKDEIAGLLQTGALKVLVCTDAASEGLNLQAAGALIDYDLPWNPSKVEQRIGRIDRIGQRHQEVRIVNLFLKDSVDEQVYRVLRERCGLFEHFVGRMQPVLAAARRVLLDPPHDFVEAIRASAEDVERESLAAETYIDNEPRPAAMLDPPVNREDLRAALRFLDGSFGVSAKEVADRCFRVTGVAGELGLTEEALDRSDRAVPLTPLSPECQQIASGLVRAGERLPLVTASSVAGAFRAAVALWVDDLHIEPVNSYKQLNARVAAWDGTYPDPARWLDAERQARTTAESRVSEMSRRAERLETVGLQRQVTAAQARLLRELGKYLVSLGHGTGDLNGVLYQQLRREDIASRQRLQRALLRLGVDYPEWPEHLLIEFDAFDRAVSPNERRGRLIGKEVDAAIADPRWLATSISL